MDVNRKDREEGMVGDCILVHYLTVTRNKKQI